MISFFKSDQPIWWNKGNEVKPNFNEFRTIQWQQLRNFNVDGVSQTQIKLTLPIGGEFDLLKVTKPGEIDRFYYLEQIINQTETTKRAIFNLDVGSTHILTNLNLPSLMTDRFLIGVNQTHPALINAAPAGYMSADKSKRMIFQSNSPEWGTFVLNLNNPATPGNRKGKWELLTTYYVFRDRQKPEYEGKASIVAIPILFELPGSNLTPNWNDGNNCFWYLKYPEFDFYALNSRENLDILAHSPSTGDQFHDLGEFMGIYQGPNVFRCEASRYIRYFLSAGQRYPTGQNVFIKTDFNNRRAAGFCALRISYDGLQLRPFNPADLGSEIAQGLTYLGHERPAEILRANRLYFLNNFVGTTPESVLDYNTQLPYIYDRFYEILNQSKATRDNSINVLNQQRTMGHVQGAFGLVSSLVGSVAAGVFNPLAGAAGAMGALGRSALGFTKTELQFQNQTRQIEAAKTDTRRKTSSEIIGANTTHLNQIDKQRAAVLIGAADLGDITESDKRAQELIYGNTYADPGHLLNFSGGESHFVVDPRNDMQNVERFYLRYPPELINQIVSQDLPPTIRAAVVTLLTNGVRIATKQEVANNFA